MTAPRSRRAKQPLPLDSLAVDRTGAAPLHRQLYWQLRRMIEERRLPAGSQLPSTRSLAVELALSRTTVISAYDQLATEGFVDFRPGARASVVALPAAPPPHPAVPVANPAVLSLQGNIMQDQPFHRGNARQLAFHPGIPDRENFPFAVWGRLLGRRARIPDWELFGSFDAKGYMPLRDAIARYLNVARGVRCRAQQIVITTGAQAALDLLARVLLNPGDTVWMEEPGYYGAQAAFASCGAQLQPLFVGDAGWDLSPPPGPPPRLIYVTPASQQPLGLTMRADQRLQLLERAQAAGALVIEDDFDGEYRFRTLPVPALHAADHPDRVIYLGTFAKLLFPALRIGFMVLPEPMAEMFDGPLRISGHSAPPLLQAALADFIDEGHMTAHLKRMRRIYAARRQQFQQLAQAHLGQWLTLLPCDVGISFVGALHDPLHEAPVIAAARRKGYSLSPLSMHYRHGQPRNGVVMGYASLTETAMPRAFRALEQLFRDALTADRPR